MSSPRSLAHRLIQSHQDAMNALAGNTSNLPVGPSAPNRQVYPIVPSFTAAFLSAKRNTRDGRGVIVPIAVGSTITAGTPITATHNLGRLVASASVISNNGGATENGTLAIGTGTRTQQTFTAGKDLLNAFVRFE